MIRAWAGDVEAAVIEKATLYRGSIITEQARKFAHRQGLTLTHYSEVYDTWTLSDGEIYSGKRILQDEIHAEYLWATGHGL